MDTETSDDTIHVIPEGDIMPHTASVNCWCCPMQDEAEKNVYIHPRWDSVCIGNMKGH